MYCDQSTRDAMVCVYLKRSGNLPKMVDLATGPHGRLVTMMTEGKAPARVSVAPGPVITLDPSVEG